MRRRRSRDASTVVLAAVAVWLIFDAGTEVLQEMRLRSGKATGHAVVVEKHRPDYVHRTWERRVERAFNRWLFEGNTSVSYVTYRLTLSDGKTLTAETPIGDRRWNALRQGSALEVEYLPSDPTVNRPAGEGPLWLAFSRLAIGAVLALLGTGLIVSRLRQRRGEREAPARSIPGP